MSLLEGLRHALRERARWVVRDEVDRELARHELRAGRLRDQQVHGLLDFVEATALDGLSQQGLAAEIVPRRVEFERALVTVESLPLGLQFRLAAGHVDANARQYSRQLLDVLL